MRENKVRKHFENNPKDRKEKGEKACFNTLQHEFLALESLDLSRRMKRKMTLMMTQTIQRISDHDDDDGERSKKKVKSSILDGFKKLLDKKMDDVMAHVDQKIESVNRHVEKLKKVDQNQNEAPEKTDEELKNMVFNCTDI